jgi:hypothetical protein
LSPGAAEMRLVSPPTPALITITLNLRCREARLLFSSLESCLGSDSICDGEFTGAANTVSIERRLFIKTLKNGMVLASGKFVFDGIEMESVLFLRNRTQIKEFK